MKIFCVEFDICRTTIDSRLFLTEKEADDFYKERRKTSHYIKKYECDDIWGFAEKARAI